jgi:hypothetical protein
MAKIDLAIKKKTSFISDKSFIEYIPLHHVEQLLNDDCIKSKWDFENYNQKIAASCYLNSQEQIKAYMKCYNKKMGGFIVKYKAARHGWGRVFPVKALGMTSFEKKSRNTLIKENYIDFDLTNAQPQILRNICKANKITHGIIEKYCNEREEIMNQIIIESKNTVNRENVKSLIIRLSFYGGFQNWLQEQGVDFPEPLIVRNYRDEVQEIAKEIALSNVELYNTMKRLKNEKGGSNYMGSFLSTYLQDYELRLVEYVLEKLCRETNICTTNTANVISAIYEFDGLKLLKTKVEEYGGIQAVIDFMNKANLELGFDIKWEQKEITKFYDIRFTDEPLQELGEEQELKSDIKNAYIKMKEEFELTHFKIINKASFMQKDSKKYFMRTKKQIIDAYEHLVYFSYENKIGDEIKVHFINEWIKDPEIKTYVDVGVYPNNAKCPLDFLNIWIPFEYEGLTSPYIPDTEGCEFVLNHLNILCNREDIIKKYFLLWIGQMIQHPEYKSTCPVFIGKQGAGKGTFMELMKKLLGDEKVLITAQPDKHVWGNFNTLMQNAYLVGLDEMSKSMTMTAVDFIKNLVTDPKININDKGHSAYMVDSYHHFAMMTNKEDGGISTEQDDRRKIMIRTSDELVGNVEYFNKFYNYLENPITMRTVYDYFRTMKDVPQKLPAPPSSDYQDNLKELSESPYIRWIKQFVIDTFAEKDTLCGEKFQSYYYMDENNEFCGRLLSGELFYKFSQWREANNEKFETTPLKMGVYLTNSRIPGISKSPHTTNKGRSKIFNFSMLNKYYNLDCDN